MLRFHSKENGCQMPSHITQAPVVQRPDNLVFPRVQANMHTLTTAKFGSVRKPWTTFNVKYILDPV